MLPQTVAHSSHQTNVYGKMSLRYNYIHHIVIFSVIVLMKSNSAGLPHNGILQLTLATNILIVDSSHVK